MTRQPNSPLQNEATNTPSETARGFYTELHNKPDNQAEPEDELVKLGRGIGRNGITNAVGRKPQTQESSARRPEDRARDHWARISHIEIHPGRTTKTSDELLCLEVVSTFTK